MQSRGRDRAVSEAAIARLKSQERLRTLTHSTSRSPSPLSSASLSPRSRSRSPTPSLTLADRIHIAYAEDVHLAKVLLLRLQGIEVTSDSDPRIAAVKDEDFDACFVPFGPLDDGRGPQPPMGKQPVAEPDAEAQRAAALRAKAQMWETEARRFTDERAKHAAQKQTQDSASVEQERIRLVKQKEAAAAAVDLRRRRNIKPTARTLNFALVPPVPKPAQKFTYDFPFTPRNINIPTRTTMPARRRSPERKPSPEQQQPASQPERTPTRVSFPEVLASMHGALFPVLPCERNTLSSSADRSRACRERALLDALLVAGVDLERDFDFSGKGKRRATTPRPCACRAVSPASPSSSVSVSVPESSTSTSSSGLSRAGSWLSFGSGSRSSRSSTATSVSSAGTSSGSGISASWASASTILSSSLSASSHASSSQAENASSPPSPMKRLSMSTWLPGARRTTSPESATHLSADAAKCHCSRLRRIHTLPRTPAQTHPLYIPPDAVSPGKERRSGGLGFGAQDHPQTAANAHMPFTLALGRLAALARNLQASYVRAVVVGYGVGVPYEEHEFDCESDEVEEDVTEYAAREKERETRRMSGRGREREPTFRPPPAPLASKLRVRPVGRRAVSGDVRRFLDLVSAPSSPPSSPSPTSTSSSASTSLPSISCLPAAADDDLAPIALLSPLPPSKSKLHGYNARAQIPPPPARTPLPAYPPPRVFAPPQPLPRSPWAPQRVPVPVPVSTPHAEPEIEPWQGDSPAVQAGPSIASGSTPRHEEEGEDEYTYAAPRQPVLRARAVPNSAFLRVKALQRAASSFASTSPESHAVPFPASDGAGLHGPSTSTTPPPMPPLTPRRPRECVVGLGVDYAPGSGLRFVYASPRAVVV